MLLLGEFMTVHSEHVALLAQKLDRQDLPVIDQFEPIADFEELFTFTEANPTPIEFSGEHPAWRLESVAARVVEALAIASHETLDTTEWVPLAKILLEHTEYLYTYPDAPTARERLAAASALAMASCVCDGLSQTELWRLAGFGRIALNLSEVPPSPSDSHILQPIIAAFQLADILNLPILETAIESYNTTLNNDFTQHNSPKFPLSDKEFFEHLNLDFDGLEDVKSAYLQEDLSEAKSEYTKYRVDIIKAFKLSSDINKTDTLISAKQYLECLLKLSIHPAPAIYATTEIGIAALLFPEFRISEQLLNLAFRRYKWIVSAFFYPDGFHKDLLVQSQAAAMSDFARFLNLYEKARQHTYSEWISEIKKSLEEQTKASIYLSKPDLSFPSFITDTETDKLDFVEKDDIGNVILKDRERKVFSHALPYSGYYVMRDGCQSNAQYLCFDSGQLGKLGYEDKLSFVLFAHGQQLITHNLEDNSGDEAHRTSKSFNSLLIDSKGQMRGQSSEHEIIPDPDARWIATTTYDFVEGWYKAEKYHHKRSIFYVKGEYYILHDTILGNGVHSVEQVFNLNTSHIMQNGNQVWTQQTGQSNIFIGAANVNDLAIHLDGKVLTFSTRRELPTVLNVVLFPMKVDVAEIPTVQSISVNTDADVLATGFTVKSKGVTDTFLISDDGYAEMSTSDTEHKIEFEGEYLFLRGDRFVMLNGRSLKVGTKVLCELDQPKGHSTNIDYSKI